MKEGYVLMKKLKANGQKILKIVHLFFVALWVGGCISAVLISFMPSMAQTNTILGIYLALEFIDYFVIIPGSSGCLITGIIYGLWTKWGFFKFKWVSVKWGLMVIQMIIGGAFLGQWVGSNVNALQTLGPTALNDQKFIMNQNLIQVLGIVQSVLLIILIGISIFKPWKVTKVDNDDVSGTQNV